MTDDQKTAENTTPQIFIVKFTTNHASIVSQA